MCSITSNFIYATLKLAISRIIVSTATIRNTVFKCKTIVPLVAFHLTLINTQVWVKDYVFTIYTCFREVLITVFYKSITKMYKSLNFEMSSNLSMIQEDTQFAYQCWDMKRISSNSYNDTQSTQDEDLPYQKKLGKSGYQFLKPVLNCRLPCNSTDNFHPSNSLSMSRVLHHYNRQHHQMLSLNMVKKRLFHF